MNVLVVHNYYRQGGGEHTVYKNECNLLKENGIQVFTYTRDNKDLHIRDLVLLPFTIIWSFRTYKKIIQLIRTKHIDIVHCHNTFPQISPSVYYACWKCGVPVVQTIHNFRFLCPNGLLFRNGCICEDCLSNGLKCGVFHKCYRNSFFQTLFVVVMLKFHREINTFKNLPCIFLTKFNQDKISNELGIKCTFIKPNFTLMKRNTDIDIDMSKFVFIGRLDKYKGITWVAEQFTHMPYLKLVIIGDGTERAKLEELSKSNNNIVLRGFRNQTEIAYELQSACALVFPSILYESFGISIIDSFALGTPVICTDIGNQGDLVKEGYNGSKFQPKDKTSFKNAIEFVLENRDLLSIGALNSANQYTPEKNINQLLAIYDKLINE